MTERHATDGPEWCSLRLRFEDRELTLLRGAEQVRGAELAHRARPTGLRDALTLAKSGHKLRAAHAGLSLTFEEHELRLLIEAAKFASEEVRWAGSQRDAAASSDPRRTAVLRAFPELEERGLWRSFALTRELADLAERLEKALGSH
jgi:hypothetical protein